LESVSPASDLTSESIPVPVGTGDFRLSLRLRRFRASGSDAAERSVLLLHGANTSSDTFLLPNGGLTRYLTQRGWQVWLLDWRGSPHVVQQLPQRPLGGSALEEVRHYTVDTVANEDLPAALREIRGRIGGAHLSILGHCVGGGSLSIAIANGWLAEFDVRRVVLSTLGLFYEVPWSGWIKAMDFILERVLRHDPDCSGIPPSGSSALDGPRSWRWPNDMERAYAHYPAAWLPGRSERENEMPRRTAFMIGCPFASSRLDPSLRAGQTDPIFGPLHLGLYLQLGQMTRRGHAAPFNAPEVVEPSKASNGTGSSMARSYLDPTWFRHLETTLVCAADNQVWHRDAIDLMHEWLRNNAAGSIKRVFPGYNIQELLWGERARSEVYPAILQGL
jgi:hypothetical protein